MTIAPTPRAMNSVPDQKSLGLRIEIIQRSGPIQVGMRRTAHARRAARRIASQSTAAREKKGRLRGLPFAYDARKRRVSDAVLGAQILEVLVEPLRLQPLLKLRLDFVVGRHLRVANVLDLDHVPAELRLHGLRRELAFRRR